MGSPQKNISTLLIPIIMCTTLGLAPFVPEPHIIKQINNILQGTFNKPLDWFDLLMHGAPWLYLIYSIISFYNHRKTN